MPSTSVKVFDSAMTGAPVLSGSAGALHAVLKACLVDGFGAGSVATLTVASGIATATFPGAHPYRIGTVSQFGGATPSGTKPAASSTSARPSANSTTRVSERSPATSCSGSRKACTGAG